MGIPFLCMQLSRSGVRDIGSNVLKNTSETSMWEDRSCNRPVGQRLHMKNSAAPPPPPRAHTHAGLPRRAGTADDGGPRGQSTSIAPAEDRGRAHPNELITTSPSPSQSRSALWSGIAMPLVLFETKMDISKKRSTCMGHGNETSQAEFQSLLGECMYVVYDVVT